MREVNSLFSNLIFKGVGRNPKTGRKKGGIKVHSVIHANEGVPNDIQFTSAAKYDHFLLSPDKQYNKVYRKSFHGCKGTKKKLKRKGIMNVFYAVFFAV